MRIKRHLEVSMLLWDMLHIARTEESGCWP